MEVVLNIKSPKVFLKYLLAVGFFLFASLATARASLNCFSFIPYALDKSFVSLPLDKEFCFFYSGDYTSMKTNEFGARVIAENQSGENIIAFGESQLLGLDYSDGEGLHDLNLVFPNKNFEIYAAPNNGPYEVLSQIEHLKQKLQKDEDWLIGKNIVIGFNYGTDIFRINDGWNPEKFVPLEKNDLEKIFFIPGYHDLLLLKARIAGKKFGSTVSNASKTINYYLEISDSQREINVERWLSKLKKNPTIRGSVKTLIIFPPYWYSAASKTLASDIRAHFSAFSCSALKSGVFKNVWVGRIPDQNIKMAEDNRHFLTNTLNYTKLNC